MVTLTLFFDTEYFGHTDIYAVNNTEPYSSSFGYRTVDRDCPHCNERSLFRFYTPKEIIETEAIYMEIYDCKCPKCNKEFEITNGYEKEELDDEEDIEYEYDFQCDETEELLMDYTAYIRADDGKDGYLYFMNEQGKSSAYLTDELEMADFLDKDFLINAIKNSCYSGAKIEIIRRDRVIKTSYEAEE